MAKRSLVQLRGFFESLPGGSRDIYPPDISNLIPPTEVKQFVLTTGANTIVVPVVNSCVGAIVIFDPTSTVAKTVQGVAGDTGLRLNPGTWNVLSLDPANLPTNIIITSAANDGLITDVIFF